MIALDTNIVVRALVQDDDRQAQIAKSLLIDPDGVYIAKTVLLEVEWVLRAAYRLSPSNIHNCLVRLLGLPGVTAESPSQVVDALQHFAHGMDFADAMHLVSSKAIGQLYTFDKKFEKLGAPYGVKRAIKRVT
jgi:predicted nucleic-acid-binding protein